MGHLKSLRGSVFNPRVMGSPLLVYIIWYDMLYNKQGLLKQRGCKPWIVSQLPELLNARFVCLYYRGEGIDGRG